MDKISYFGAKFSEQKKYRIALVYIYPENNRIQEFDAYETSSLKNCITLFDIL